MPRKWSRFSYLAAVGLCANIANLLLARATGRQQEIALRTALGASRSRLVRQFLIESLMVAFAGGICGIALAWIGTSTVAAIAPREIPRIEAVKVDSTALLFGLAASVLAAGLFGLAPAIRSSRVDLTESLKELAKSTAGRGKQGLRNTLAVGEFALAFVLVMGAGLLAKSFLRLMKVDLGFDSKNVLTLSTYVYSQRYGKPEQELGSWAGQVNRVPLIHF